MKFTVTAGTRVLYWRAMIFVQKSWVGLKDFRWQRYQAFQQQDLQSLKQRLHDQNSHG